MTTGATASESLDIVQLRPQRTTSCLRTLFAWSDHGHRSAECSTSSSVTVSTVYSRIAGSSCAASALTLNQVPRSITHFRQSRSSRATAVWLLVPLQRAVRDMGKSPFRRCLASGAVSCMMIWIGAQNLVLLKSGSSFVKPITLRFLLQTNAEPSFPH